ncbi:MAG: hypothetical protein AAF587_13280 [Bacteroidota bacterium]
MIQKQLKRLDAFSGKETGVLDSQTTIALDGLYHPNPLRWRYCPERHVIRFLKKQFDEIHSPRKTTQTDTLRALKEYLDRCSRKIRRMSLSAKKVARAYNNAHKKHKRVISSYNANLQNSMAIELAIANMLTSGWIAGLSSAAQVRWDNWADMINPSEDIIQAGLGRYNPKPIQIPLSGDDPLEKFLKLHIRLGEFETEIDAYYEKKEIAFSSYSPKDWDNFNEDLFKGNLKIRYQKIAQNMDSSIPGEDHMQKVFERTMMAYWIPKLDVVRTAFDSEAKDKKSKKALKDKSKKVSWYRPLTVELIEELDKMGILKEAKANKMILLAKVISTHGREVRKLISWARNNQRQESFLKTRKPKN